MSKNLFSLTEQLPKNKYRKKSTDLRRDTSNDSFAVLAGNNTMVTPQRNLNNFKLKQIEKVEPMIITENDQ